MLMKQCRCGKIIPQAMKMCDQCAAKKESRHVEYNRTRRDKNAAAFYMSTPWKRTRRAVMDDFDNIDPVALYIFNEILPTQEVHHIEELDEAWNKRFDRTNLIPLHHNTHTRITYLYKHSEATKKQVQAALKKLLDYHFGIEGDIKIVLDEMQYVAPSLFFRENSPLEFSEQ